MKREKDKKMVEVTRGKDKLPLPHMYTNYMFKNYKLLQIDPLSAYKIMACNKFVYNLEHNRVYYNT